MPVSACITYPAPYPQQLATTSNNIILLQSKLGNIITDNNGRPFLPLWGMKKTTISGVDTYQSLTAAQNGAATFTNLVLAFFNDCYIASKNYATDVLGSTEITDSNFKDYLYKLLFDKPERLSRYFSTAGVIMDFNTANVATAIAAYVDAQNRFAESMKNIEDKNFYIPNGTYFFAPASNTAVAFAAMIAAVPSFIGFYGLEVTGSI